MSDDELMDDANWDHGSAEVHPPVKNPRAVVSVAFSHNEFDQVSRMATAAGMKTSAFIRYCALSRRSTVISVSGRARFRNTAERSYTS